MGMETGNGKRRIDAPRDHVRLELELALSRNIPVIPALVRKASIPLKMRCHHRCALLHIVTAGSPDPDFHADIDRLIKGIETHLSHSAQS